MKNSYDLTHVEADFTRRFFRLGATASAPRVTEPQARVLVWLLGGWAVSTFRSNVFEVNGRKICNGDTMARLQRLGLVERLPDVRGVVSYKASEKAKREFRVSH